MYEFAVGTEALFGERYAQWANLVVPGVDLDRARAASPPCGLTSPEAGPTSFPRWPTRTYRGRFLSGAKWAPCSVSDRMLVVLTAGQRGAAVLIAGKPT